MSETVASIGRTAAICVMGIVGAAGAVAGGALGAGVGGVANLTANRRSADRAKRGDVVPGHHYIAEGTAVGAGLGALFPITYVGHRYRQGMKTVRAQAPVLKSAFAPFGEIGSIINKWRKTPEAKEEWAQWRQEIKSAKGAR